MCRLQGIPKNLSAVIDTIAYSEMGNLMTVGDEAYNILVGSTVANPLLFNSYADHPRIYNAKFNSTAAGLYQIIKGTFDQYKLKLGLTGFYPEDQDRIAIGLIKDKGAYNDALEGNLYRVFLAVSPVWASLPYSTAGQHTNKMNDLLTYFQGLL